MYDSEYIAFFERFSEKNRPTITCTSLKLNGLNITGAKLLIQLLHLNELSSIDLHRYCNNLLHA